MGEAKKPLEQYETPDLRALLQKELIRRIENNRYYSLRSFARFLQVEPSSLSKILRGKRQISAKMAARLTERLGLPESYAKASSGRESSSSLNRYRRLGEDTFRMMSDWYHYAILELVSLDNFVPNIRWVASRLQLGVTEAKLAVDRLCQLGFLEILSNGDWKVKTGPLTTVGYRDTTAAYRNHQKQVLELSQKALEEVPVSLRDHSSMTMAIRKDQLLVAKERIKEFRRKFCEEFNSGEHFDEVYHLSVSFYPVTQVEKKKGQPA